MTAPQALLPDVRQLADETLPTGAFPADRQETFRVFFAAAAHDDIWKHGRADTSVEICGVLVGGWERDDRGPFVNIAASIRGDAAANKFAEVTFTHETWSKINAEMDAKHPNRKIVGWYHSHPDFGIFLSDRDCFIQENFFSGPGQVAHVIDPVRLTEGVFVWHDGKPKLATHFWAGDRLVVAPAERSPEGHATSTPHLDEPSLASDDQPARAPWWLSFLQSAIMYLLVFLVGYMLAGQLNDWALMRARQEGVAMAIYQLGLRPDLETKLSEIRADLLKAGDTCIQLQKADLDLLTKAEAKPEQLEDARITWNEVALRLERARQGLAVAQRDYCLTERERDLLNSLFQARRLAESQAEDKSKPTKSPATTPPKNDAPTKPSPDGANADTNSPAKAESAAPAEKSSPGK